MQTVALLLQNTGRDQVKRDKRLNGVQSVPLALAQNNG